MEKDGFSIKDDRSYIEQKLSNRKRGIFLLIYPYEKEIWVDSNALPQTAIFCAMCDGITLLQAAVGEKKRKIRYFLPMEWCIKEWGGPKSVVEAMEKRRNIIFQDLDRMKKALANQQT